MKFSNWRSNGQRAKVFGKVDTLETYHLTIGLGVSHWWNIKPNMLTLTKIFHSTVGQITAIISYNVVGKTKLEDHLFDELNHRRHVTLANWLCFNPLCKFVNRHQEVCLFIFGPFERPNHIKPPDCKRPSNWNHPQFLSRHVNPSWEFLATITFTDQILRISVSRQPIKPMTKSFGHKRLWTGMMATIPFMNFP